MQAGHLTKTGRTLRPPIVEAWLGRGQHMKTFDQSTSVYCPLSGDT
jgi:hypothetical protein